MNEGGVDLRTLLARMWAAAKSCRAEAEAHKRKAAECQRRAGENERIAELLQREIDATAPKTETPTNPAEPGPTT